MPAGPGYQVPLAHEVRQATGAITRAVGLITDPITGEDVPLPALGAKAHFPSQYHLARSEGWRRIRDQNAASA